MPELDLAKLWGLFESDRARKLSTSPLWAALSTPSERELQRVTRWVERTHADVFGLFGSEDEVRVAIVDEFESPGPAPKTLRDLAAALSAEADREWLSVAPLVNLFPPKEAILLAPGRVLVASTDGDGADRFQTRAAIDRLLGADADPGSRRIYATTDHLIDTRLTATLVVRGRGTRRACDERARRVAQFAIAVWTLLRPPHDDIYMALWPAV